MRPLNVLAILVMGLTVFALCLAVAWLIDRKEMLMKRLSLVALLTLFAGSAHAASTTLTIVVNGPTSSGVYCQPSTLTAPLAAGSVVCPITTTPSGWSGVLAISGADAAKFTLAGTNLVVGATALPAGSYSVTITSTP